MDIKIIVATHKKYWMPLDQVYLPLHVGKCGKDTIGYLGDDTLDNISIKNKNYCELTGLYWAWKNLHCDYIGLCHYRRYFAHSKHSISLEAKKAAIFHRADYEKLLRSYDVILPKKRNYYIETVRSQYEHAHNKNDLSEVRKIIKENYPEYSISFDKVMNMRELYLYNMFVTKKELFDSYCLWLFSVLFELENKIDVSKYDDYQGRVFGFLSERLFNVWLNKQRLNIIEVPVVFMEKENWNKKIYLFLKRKFLK